MLKANLARKHLGLAPEGIPNIQEVSSGTSRHSHDVKQESESECSHLQQKLCLSRDLESASIHELAIVSQVLSHP